MQQLIGAVPASLSPGCTSDRQREPLSFHPPSLSLSLLVSLFPPLYLHSFSLISVSLFPPSIFLFLPLKYLYFPHHLTPLSTVANEEGVGPLCYVQVHMCSSPISPSLFSPRNRQANSLLYLIYSQYHFKYYNNNTVGVQDQLGRVKGSPKEARKAYRKYI